jgi:serine/threonine-protein kinase
MGESLLDTWYACQDRQLMLPYDIIAWIGARAAEGLHHAHELRDPTSNAFERIVHRDVNPGNVFLTYEGQVKVIDFGVAKALNRLSSTTSFGTLKGKVSYMAPEQAKTSDVDRRADIFSLAVTLYELTTDRRLFKRKTDVDTLVAVTKTDVPDPSTAVPGYPPDLSQILLRALQGNRDLRYSNALDFSRELDRFAQTQGRSVDATTLAEVMNYLFWDQRNRFVQWLKTASAGEQSEILRAPGSQKQLAMASIDVAPLSKRAGQTLPIRGSMPSIEVPAPQPVQAQPPRQNFGMTVPLAAQAPGMPPIAMQRPPSQPPPPMMPPDAGDQTVYNPVHAPPRTPVPMMGPPMGPPGHMTPIPMHAPMQAPAPYGQIQLPPEIVRASQVPPKSNIVSNIIFFLIAGLGVLGIAAYFLYTRLHAHLHAVPSATIPSITAPPPVVDSGAPIVIDLPDLPEPLDASDDVQQETGVAPSSPDSGATAAPTHHHHDPPPSDDVLLKRR